MFNGDEEKLSPSPKLPSSRASEKPKPRARSAAGRALQAAKDSGDYSAYWWCSECTSSDVAHPLEEIDDEWVFDELNKQIQNNQFPVIEISQNELQVIELLNNDDFDFAEVAYLINKSPAMAGEFIALVNSSVCGRGVRINDLRTALPRLGRDSVRAMLYLYSCKINASTSKELQAMATSIVNHSYATAIIASYLSQRYFHDPDTAFLAGLLHDVGKLGILTSISEYSELQIKTKEAPCEETFGRTFPEFHAVVGSFLAKKWNIDDLVISAIEHHHDFFECGFDIDEQEHYMLSALINLSDAIACILGKGRNYGEINIFDLVSTSELNIDLDEETLKFLDEIPAIIENNF